MAGLDAISRALRGSRWASHRQGDTYDMVATDHVSAYYQVLAPCWTAGVDRAKYPAGPMSNAHPEGVGPPVVVVASPEAPDGTRP